MANILSMETTVAQAHVLKQLHEIVKLRTLEGYYVKYASGGYVSQRAAGANMSVDVDPITYYLAGVPYVVAAVVNKALGASNATMPRIDILYYNSSGTISIAAGTPAAKYPSTEAVWQKLQNPVTADMSGVPGLILAEIYVAAGATAIHDADIRMLGAPVTIAPELVASITAPGSPLKAASEKAVCDALVVAGSGPYVWKQETNFTAAPTSTSTLTMTRDVTNWITSRCGLRYTIGGIAYYGIIDSITPTLMTIAGAPLSGTVTKLEWCDPSYVIQEDFVVTGAFADAANATLLATDVHRKFKWGRGKAYLAKISHTVRVDDSGAAQPKVTIALGNKMWTIAAPQSGAETFIRSLVILNGVIYGGTYPNGKLLAWNGTNAWVEVAPKYGAETYIYALAVLNGVLYGGTSPGGKLLAWNGTNAWVEVASMSGAEYRILSLIVSNNALYAGTNPTGKLLRAKVGNVGTDNTNAGLAVAETWVSTVVGINTGNYDTLPGENLEIVADAAGSNDDAVDLTISLLFVLQGDNGI